MDTYTTKFLMKHLSIDGDAIPQWEMQLSINHHEHPLVNMDYQYAPKNITGCPIIVDLTFRWYQNAFCLGASGNVTPANAGMISHTYGLVATGMVLRMLWFLFTIHTT